MTRQPKTIGLFSVDEFNEACRLILVARRGYRRWARLRKIRNGIVQRRRKKGRRAKSGQWWRREHQPSTRSWAQAIDADLDRCMTIIDEHQDSRLGVDFANGGDKTVYRMPDGTIQVETNRTNA